LPELLKQSNFYYTFLGFWGENTGSDIILKYSFLPYIYKNNDILFTLKPENIFQLNEAFTKYNRYEEINLDLLNTFTFIVNDITVSEDKIFVLSNLLSASDNNELRNKYILQKYDYEGNLLASEYFDRQNFKIQKIKYNRSNNSLYIFYLEGEFWKFRVIDL
jgi:hypothetical protein